MRHLFSQKDNATFKIDIFWKVGIGEDNFKKCDILVGKPRETRGNTTKISIFKYYIICRIKIPKISKRESSAFNQIDCELTVTKLEK